MFYFYGSLIKTSFFITLYREYAITCLRLLQFCTVKYFFVGYRLYSPMYLLWLPKSTFFLQKRSFGTKYSRIDQVKFVEYSLQKIWSYMVFVPQISLDPFLNTLSRIYKLDCCRFCIDAPHFLFVIWLSQTGSMKFLSLL